MKQTLKYTVLMIHVAAALGCATYDIPYVRLLPERVTERSVVQEPVNQPPTRTSGATQVVATLPRQPQGNSAARGTAIPPRPLIVVEPLPSPPVKDSLKLDPIALDESQPKTPEEHVADVQRIFELRNEESSHARLADAIPVRPGIRPPPKAIPYWSRQEDGSDAGQLVDEVSDRNADGALNETPAVVTWPSPVTLPPSVDALWHLYRAFQFREVIDSVTRVGASDQLNGYTLATACTLAAASAYIANDQHAVKAFIVRSVSACPAVRPDPMVFPTSFCAIYRNTVAGIQKDTDTNSD